MNRVRNEKNNDEIGFLNERVIKYRKEDIIRLIFLVIICAAVFGVVACVSFFCAKPFFSEYFSKTQKSKQQDMSFVPGGNNSNDVIKIETTAPASEIETTIADEAETEPDKIISQEDMYKSVAIIVCGDNEKLTDADMDSENVNTTSGLVIHKGENISILTFYDKVKGLNEVTVYFDTDKSYIGRIKYASADYKMAIIEVSGENISETELEEINTAVLSVDEECFISEQVTFIGNLLGKKKLMANGSLTLVGNTVSIMDGEVEILATDIAKAGEMDGFAFDEMGRVIGMTLDEISGNDWGDNVVSLIRIRDMEPYIDRLLNNQKIPCIGIYGRQVTDEVIKNIDNEMPYGIYISNMKENSPAYLAGIMNGDVLVGMDDKTILNFDDYIQSLHKCEAGREIIVTVMRKGKDGYKQFKYAVKVNGR